MGRPALVNLPEPIFRVPPPGVVLGGLHHLYVREMLQIRIYDAMAKTRTEVTA
jgi:hypothetical protein